MFAYLFWHWKQAKIAIREYEARQRVFHQALASTPSTGYLGSFSLAIAHVPWAADGGKAYEDWYLLEDFSAIGLLNQAAVAASNTEPHNAAAEFVAGGTAGIYKLQLGTTLLKPQYAYWFSKPHGVTYQDLFEQLAPFVEQVHGALWVRQMVLGPAREFCLHTSTLVSWPALANTLLVQPRSVWPEL